MFHYPKAVSRRPWIAAAFASVLTLGSWPAPVHPAGRPDVNAEALRGKCAQDDDVVPESFVRVPTADTETIRIRLKGVDYHIPKYKLLYPAVECRSGDNISVLIGPSEATNSPGHSDLARSNLLERTTLLGSTQIISLDRLRSMFLMRRVEAHNPQVSIDIPGVVIGPINPDGRYGADLYDGTSASGGGVVILCRRVLPEDGEASFCSLWLPYRNVSWQINFSRRDLAQWREVSRDVETLLDQFTSDQ